jgi:hypothetical protein
LIVVVVVVGGTVVGTVVVEVVEMLVVVDGATRARGEECDEEHALALSVKTSTAAAPLVTSSIRAERVA